MKSYRPGKGQIHGKQNSTMHDKQQRKLAKQQKPKKSKDKVPPNPTDSAPYFNLNFKRMSWTLLLFLLIIIPGIFLNARFLRVFSGAAKANDKPTGLPLSAVKAQISGEKQPLNNGTGDAGFIEVQVQNPCKFDRLNPFSFPGKLINIIIKTYNNIRELPYADVEALDPEKSKDLIKYGIKRDLHTRVALRGETRSIEEISEAGGFHPQFTNPNNNPNHNDSALDIYCHRKACHLASGFVSTTVSHKIAHKFGCDRYTVYSVLATGALMPADNTATSPSLQNGEVEYSVPGGIDKEDIVAYRHCGKVNKYEKKVVCSNVYLNSIFAKKYPHLVDDVINTQLVCDEKISP